MSKARAALREWGFGTAAVGVLALSLGLVPDGVSASIARQPVTRGPSQSVDWPEYNNDLISSRYSLLSQISTSNVSGLHPVCAAQLGLQSRFETGPIVVAGVLYATVLGKTYAMDATTCRSLWTNSYQLSSGAAGTNHGVAFGNGRLFRGFVNGHVIGIDAASGQTVWDTNVIARGSYEYIVAAPIAWRGAIYIGTAGGDDGQAAHVYCIDQATGDILWRIQTVPTLVQSLASTWKGAGRIAGGSTWTSYTLDPTTARLYVSVSNPGPVFDVRLRGGPNLYTDSVLTINAMTGAVESAFQITPQDYHDWDLGATPAVVTLSGGAKVALSAGKDGYLRELGLSPWAIAWQTPATTMYNTQAPLSVTGTRFCPGTTGGVLWNGPAFSPQTQDAYIGEVDWCTTVDLSPQPQPYVPGQPWLGSTNYFGSPDATSSGWVVAANASTGNIAWSYHSPTPMIAGVTATAGGLLLTADLDGNVLAFNASSGSLLTTIATGRAIGGGVVTYSVGGKQYVAVAAGMASSVFNTPNVKSELVVMSL